MKRPVIEWRQCVRAILNLVVPNSRDQKVPLRRRSKQLGVERLEDRTLLAVAFGLGTAGQESGQAVAVDSLNRTIVVSQIQGTIDFDFDATGTSNMGTAPGTDMVISKYNNDGTLIWSKSLSTVVDSGTNTSTNSSVVPQAVAVDGADNIYVTGYMGTLGTGSTTTTTVDFDPNDAGFVNTAAKLTNTGGADPFLAKYAPDGTFVWARTIGSTAVTDNDEVAWDLAVDPAGNVYWCGGLNVSSGASVTYDLDADPAVAKNYTNAGLTDGFVTKYNTAGTFQWGFGLGSTTDDEVSSIALDKAGHVFVSGSFSGTVDFNHASGTADLVSSGGSNDLFVARYALDGTYQQGVKIGNGNNETMSPGSLRTDSNITLPLNNVYFTGQFTGSVDIDPSSGGTINLANANSDNIFVASFTSDLTAAMRWGFSLPSNIGPDSANRIGLDFTGANLYLSGGHSGTTEFDGVVDAAGRLVSSNAGADNDTDIFLAKYTASTGAFQWAQQFGVGSQVNSSFTAGMAIDQQGAPWITGQFNGTNVPFNPTGPVVTLSSSGGSNDAFLAKYDLGGTFLANNPPRFDVIGGQAFDEDTVGSVVITGISPGFGVAESPGQTVSFSAISSDPTIVQIIGFTGSGATRTLKYTNPLNVNGGVNITVTADDLQSRLNTSSQVFSVGINPINDVPTISNILDKSTNEDVATPAITFTIGDVDDAATTLIVTGSSDNLPLVPNANIVFGGSGTNRTVTVTPALNQFGTATITVTVTDPQGGVNTPVETFLLTVNSVNDVPTISSIPNRTTTISTATPALPITVGDVETAVASLVVTGSSSNPSLVPNANIVFGGSGASRTVTVTPTTGQLGTALITVTVTDTNAPTASASTTFDLSVIVVNQPPTISDIKDQSSNEDAQSAAFAFTVGDIETSPALLTVFGTSSNKLLIPDRNIVFGGLGGSRTVTLTPTTDQVGTTTITVTTTDEIGTSVSDTFVLTVNPVNDLPTISDIPNQTTNQNAPTGAISVLIDDVETSSSSLTLTGISSNTALVPTANIVFGGGATNRTVTVTPTANQSGTSTITVTVSDGTVGGTMSDTFILTVTPAGDLPTITDIANLTINKNTSTGALTFTVGDVQTAATDLNVSGSSSDTALVPNNNIVFGGSGASRTVTVTPAANKSGVATITVTVKDGAGSTKSDTFDLTVFAPNTPPTIGDITNQSTNEDTPTANLNFAVGDGESDASVLTVNAVSSNATLVPVGGIVFGGSSTNRTLKITPALNQSGKTTITVTVTDEAGSTKSDTFDLTVNPVNDPPTISNTPDQTTSEEVATGAISFTIADVDSSPTSLTVSASSSNAALVPNGNIVIAGTGATRTLTITPALNQSGTATITVTVTDGSETSSDTFVLTVSPVNDLPTITEIADQTTSAGVPTASLNFVVSDLETAAGALVVTGSSSNPALVTDGNILFAGSGTSRTVTVVPIANQKGTATITVTVNDGKGGTKSDSFVLTVSQKNEPPVISDIENQTTLEDVATIPYGFTVQDPDTEASALIVTAVSSDTTLVPVSNIQFGGSGQSRTISVLPGANRSGTAIITVTVDDGAGGKKSVAFGITVSAVNDPPTISDIANRSTNENVPAGPVDFIIGDPELSPGALTVSASSSNPALVPDGNLALDGSGSNRTLTATPVANQSGTSTIKITVSDGQGGTTTKSFLLTIDNVNDRPTISAIPDLTINSNTPGGPINFIVGDTDSEAKTLNVSAVSSNTDLVPSGGIVFGGSGEKRSLKVIPAANQIGTTSITVTVTDTNGGTSSDTFLVTVNAVQSTGAGNVQVRVRNGQLLLIGDNLANQVEVRAGTAENTFQIVGLGTTINGSTGPLLVSGVTREIKASLKDGNDLLIISGPLTLFGSLNVNAGKGDDVVRIGQPRSPENSIRLLGRDQLLDGGAGSDLLDAGLTSVPNANGITFAFKPIVKKFEK